MEPCPCGTSLPYSECCEPFILGIKPAPTAEALIRSRYTAYTRSEVDYIISTTHPDQRKQDSENNIRQWAQKSGASGAVGNYQICTSLNFTDITPFSGHVRIDQTYKTTLPAADGAIS